MSERNYYVFCEDGCKFPAMTAEQVLAAIAEATGNTPTNINAAFITKIKESNTGGYVTFWRGTTDEYNAIETIDPNCFYIKKDDTTIDDINKAIVNMGENIAALEAVHELTVTSFLGKTTDIDSTATPDTDSSRDCSGEITFRRQGHICTASFDIFVERGKGQVFLFYENMLDIPEKFRPKTTAFQVGVLHDEIKGHTTEAEDMAVYINNTQMKIVIKKSISDSEMDYCVSHKLIGTLTYFV